jgi:hypothetical protein
VGVFICCHLPRFIPNVIEILVKIFKKNFFPSSLTTRPKTLEHLSLETLSSWVLEIEGKARANPIGATSFLGKPLVLLANVRLDWKVIASYKNSSLFGLVISDEGKKFYDIDCWSQSYKTFFSPSLLAGQE